MTARRALDPTDDPGRSGRSKGWIALVVSIVVLVGGAGIAWVVARDTVRGWFTVADYPGPGGDEIVVTIPKGASITRIGEILTQERVVASGSAFVRAAAEVSEASSIQAGNFRLRTEIPARTAVEMLLDPANAERSGFTLREGGWLSDHVEAMAKAGGIPVDEFETLLEQPEELGLPDWADGNAEGLLFPDTYELPDPVTAEAMIVQATTRFHQVAAELDLEAGAAALDLTPLEAVTVASIVEREVARAEDRPKVARVIYNRLATGMRLQMDSTVHFASGERGSVWTSDEARASDSPYNTYKHKGLPPGPISSPGRAALEAALHPDEGDWLFFVAVNLDTGETRFSANAAGHAKAVEELHAWCAASDQNRTRCG